MNSITLQLGQAVPWPPAASQIAQVIELRRTQVRLCYPCKNGRLRYPIVRPSRLAKLIHATPLIPINNPYRRAMRGGAICKDFRL